MSNDKNKKNSSLNSATSLVNSALKLKKDKPGINEILTEQKPTDHKEGRSGGNLENHDTSAANLLSKEITSEESKKLNQENEEKSNSLLPEPAAIEVEPSAGKINIGDNKITPGEEKPVIKVEPVKISQSVVSEIDNNPSKKKKQFSNFDLFLVPNKNVSKGLAIYVRPEYHSKIVDIISSLGDKSLTIAAYVDNVLTAHFEQFEKDVHKRKLEILEESLRSLSK